VLASGDLGGADYGELCARRLESLLGVARVLLTPSCTIALELAVQLLELGPGDEVVMPSFTSAATATAVVRCGAVPVFADIHADAPLLDPEAAAAAVTPRTRAIMAVHYGGIACEVGHLGLPVVEDAAQAIGASWRGRALGGLGVAGCLSFHATKNVTCGEGGALALRDPDLVARAEVLRDKGTDRARFLRGEAPAYTWLEAGTAAMMSELQAAVLLTQLEQLEEITARRRALWDAYHERLAELEDRGVLRRPRIPAGALHNGHVYWVLVERRDEVIAALRPTGVQAAFHFLPLHSSPAGRRFGRTHGSLAVTERVAASLVRLPVWVGMTEGDVDRVACELAAALA